MHLSDPHDDTTDEKWMRHALREAEQAASIDEVPIGAVVVCDERIIGRGHNQREQLHDPTAHAEMIAITAAAESLADWRLEQCTIYVTLEPCPMCAGAIVLARIARLVYGASDPKAGACDSLYRITSDARLNHRVPTESGIFADECGRLLTQFFADRRADGKK